MSGRLHDKVALVPGGVSEPESPAAMGHMETAD